jgi:hypothetical protein
MFHHIMARLWEHMLQVTWSKKMSSKHNWITIIEGSAIVVWPKYRIHFSLIFLVQSEGFATKLSSASLSDLLLKIYN